MSERHIIEEIEAVSGSKKSENVQSPGTVEHVEEPIEVTGQANKAEFDALMDQQRANRDIAKVEMDPSAKPGSLQEISQADTRIDPVERATLEDIKKHINTSVSNIDQMRNDLSTVANSAREQNLNLDLHFRPYKTQMRNRLSHIEESLQIALSKTGQDAPGTEAIAGTPGNKYNPVEEFLGRLNQIETQMQGMGNYLDFMARSGQEITGANMLAIQLKTTQIGQEVEFFAGLLSKALESVKTIMNIQV
ncbi:MAG: hypothetical protein Tsb0021_12850 [Chlamydiales bacterium]